MKWPTPCALVLAGSLLLMSCAAPVPRPTSLETRPSSAGSTPTPSGALLSITGSGTIPSGSPYGCLASLLIDPEPSATDRMATWDDARFAVNALGAGPGCPVSGLGIGGPAALTPGRYHLAGVASLVSDVPSPGFSHMPLMGTTVRCDRDLLVLPATTGIAVHVTFNRDGPCTIEVTTR